MAATALDYDVAIIGAGGAGLSAAATASAAGARVLLIEAATRTGGSTALAGGVYYAAGTSLQRECGVDDPGPDNAFRYYMTLNQYKLEAALVRRLCDDAPAAFEWLRSIGVEFAPDDLYAAGVDKLRRGHRASGGGAAIAAAIEGSFAGRPVDIAFGTRVGKLAVENGTVVGVEVDGTTIRTGAVVIATGGFGANPAMLTELYPDAARHGDAHWYIGVGEARGDGIAMGRDAGAAIAGVNRGLLLLTPGFNHDLEAYLPGWLMLVDPDGRRFIDETIEYSVLAAALHDKPGGACFGIFDEAQRLASKSTAYRPTPNWTADRLAEHADAGLLARAGTLDELALAIGVAPDALATAVERNNADFRRGDDGDFFKPAALLREIAMPPFYAARITASIICWTGTGLRIDRDARVLDCAGRAIPRLFAAGETTGGMFGECYASGGASIANAVVFGRAAGVNAAALALGEITA